MWYMTIISYRHKRRIAAPADRVWALTADVEGLPALTPTMTDVQRLDDRPLAVGSRVSITQPRSRARTWTVETLDPPRLMVWSTTVGRVRMTARHVITPDGEGCTNELGIDLEGPGARLMALLFGRSLRGVLEQENEGFAVAAEAHGRDRHGSR